MVSTEIVDITLCNWFPEKMMAFFLHMDQAGSIFTVRQERIVTWN